MSNPDVYTPYGSQTVTYGGEKKFDEAAYNKALSDFQNNGGYQTAKNFDANAYLAANPDVAASSKYGNNAFQHYMDWGRNEGRQANYTAPTKDMFTTDVDPDKVTVRQSLTPEQQALFDQQNRISTGLGNIAEGGISRVGNMLGSAYDSSGLPAFTGSVDSMSREIQRGYGPTRGQVQYGVDPRFDQTGDQVQEALYRKQTQMLDPQFQQQSSDLSSRLANQGIMPGSEAYNREMNNFARNQQNAYESARDAAILAGGQEQSRLNEMGLSRAQLNNAAQAQELADLMGRAGFNNAAIGQMFGQNLSSAQFGNQARQNKLQEDLTLRQLPLNEMTALMSGTQVNIPQFQQYSGTTVQPTNLMGAAQAQGQADQNMYNAKSAQASGNMQAGASIAAAIAAF